MLQIRYWNEIDDHITTEIKKNEIKHNQASNLSLLKLNFLMKFSLNPPLARFEIFPFFAVHFNISLINFIPGGPAGRFVFLLSHHRKAADGTSHGEFHFLEFSECASPRTNGRWRGGVRGVDRLALGLL